jgi:hypothetical protein
MLSGRLDSCDAAGRRDIARGAASMPVRIFLSTDSIGGINGSFATHRQRLRLAASASSAALSLLKTASMASGSSHASSSSPASTSSW